MAPCRFRSMFVCKLVIVVALVAHGLFCAGNADASEAAAALSVPLEYPQCNTLSCMSLDCCETWCLNHGHPGGYIKSDVCCCNSGWLDDDA